MSMDLCYIDNSNCVGSLINVSNGNCNRFTTFVADVLQDNITQWQEVVDSQDLTVTGDDSYDSWKRERAAEERDELISATNLYQAWSSENCNVSDVLLAMSVCINDPNAKQYLGYIARIVKMGTEVLMIGNPRTYWA